MIVFKKFGLRMGAAFLDEEPAEMKVDRLLYLFRTTPIEGALCNESHTLFLGLQKRPDELMAGFDKTTAYEIRRAKDKDLVCCEWIDVENAKAVDAFWDCFQAFSSTMGYPTTGAEGREWLGLLANDKRLQISSAKSPAGEVLAYHAYCLGQRRVRLYHACSMHKTVDQSSIRALIGRANRLLFWADLLHFQQQGIMEYDFGGWYADKDDPQMLRVNRFKEAFGGQVTKTYTCRKGCSLKGKLAVWLQKRFHRQH